MIFNIYSSYFWSNSLSEIFTFTVLAMQSNYWRFQSSLFGHVYRPDSIIFFGHLNNPPGNFGRQDFSEFSFRFTFIKNLQFAWQMQWGSEHKTNLDFKWSGFPMAQKQDGIHFGYHLIFGIFEYYSNHLNTGQVLYWNGSFISSCRMVRYSNGGLKTMLKICNDLVPISFICGSFSVSVIQYWTI